MSISARIGRSVRGNRVFFVLALTMALALVGVVKGVAIVQQEPSEAQKEYARLAALHELTRHHWRNLEPLTEFRVLIDGLADMNVGPVHDRWSMKFLSEQSKSADGLDHFEITAMAEIMQGKDEVWKTSDGKIARYVRTVRAVQQCIACHPGNNDKPTEEGDVIGVVSLECSQRSNSNQGKKPPSPKSDN